MPRKKKPAKDLEKAAQSKAAWDARERLKNVRGRYEAALILSKLLMDEGNVQGAMLVGQWGAALALVNGLNE